MIEADVVLHKPEAAEEADEKLVLNGTHGTTKRRAAAISRDGINGGPGRGGTGAYFWRDDGRFAVELARKWFDLQQSKKRYNDELNPECAVIFASIHCLDSEVLDLEDVQLKDELATILEEQGYGFDPAERELGGAHDLLVNRVEQKLGHRFKVLKVKVAAPPNAKYPVKALGSPLVYICRRPKKDWVKIEKVV